MQWSTTISSLFVQLAKPYPTLKQCRLKTIFNLLLTTHLINIKMSVSEHKLHDTRHYRVPVKTTKKRIKD